MRLRGQRVVVVGGGKIAARKAAGLASTGARVRVIAPRIERGIAAGEIERRRYRAGDLAGAALAFAATDDRAVNHAVALEARRRRIPVNVADAAEECTFMVPARVRRGNVEIAISTGGRSPRLAKELRQRLEKVL
jgi:siroheme synthase-like protein